MDTDTKLRRFCDFYIRHAGLIGAAYSVLPSIVGFGILFASVPFRQVYLLRLAISLVFGSAIGAYVHRFGLSLWLMKHRSREGPGTLADGALMGAAVGWSAAIVAPLTSLIASNHPEFAKTFVISAWMAATAIGGFSGTTLAAIGRKHVDRPTPEGGD